MADRPTIGELKGRIEADLHHFRGALPERVAIAWDGYLAALLEWDLISPAEHREAAGLLPTVPDNPVVAILLGRDSQDLGPDAAPATSAAEDGPEAGRLPGADLPFPPERP